MRPHQNEELSASFRRSTDLEGRHLHTPNPPFYVQEVRLIKWLNQLVTEWITTTIILRQFLPSPIKLSCIQGLPPDFEKKLHWNNFGDKLGCKMQSQHTQRCFTTLRTVLGGSQHETHLPTFIMLAEKQFFIISLLNRNTIKQLMPPGRREGTADLTHRTLSKTKPQSDYTQVCLLLLSINTTCPKLPISRTQLIVEVMTTRVKASFVLPQSLATPSWASVVYHSQS